MGLSDWQPKRGLPIFLLLGILLVLAVPGTCFTYTATTVALSNYEISAVSAYTFNLLRMYDISLNPTPYDSTPLSPSDSATVVFPQ